ncbi:uncharacterized protein [Miscanthus floridulus]|uniref:uncharacterized protein n=1 Tax=Miscanthus floridulus TaxID=154761 RepID=UPI003458E273
MGSGGAGEGPLRRGQGAGAAPPLLGLSQAAAAPDARAGGGEGWRRWWDGWGGRHSRASAPTWASWSCTDTYAGTVESCDADSGYFHEGYPAARLHPMQLLLPTPTRGISTTPQKIIFHLAGTLRKPVGCWQAIAASDKAPAN